MPLDLKMNLLLVNYEYPPIGAGAANATWYLAEMFAQKQHNVTVLTSSFQEKRGKTLENNVYVYRSLSLRKKQAGSNILEMITFLVSAMFMLPLIIRARKPDGMIIFFSLPCGPLGLLGKKKFGIPYVISIRGGDVPGAEPGLSIIHRILKPLRRKIYKESIAVVAPSEGLKQMAEKADPIRVTVIENGVDTNFFKPSGRHSKRENQELNLLFVGRFQKQKNLFFLLQEMGLFMKNVDMPFRLHMVGDGPQKNDLVRFSQKNGLGKRVVWHGWVNREQLAGIYQQADCLLNLSFYEGMSNVVLEAMAYGLPVIASKVPGNVEVVENNITGFLIDVNSSGQFQRVLEKMVSNPKRFEQMGEKSRNRVETFFAWSQSASKYESLFETE